MSPPLAHDATADALKKAASGLIFPSEHDAPLVAYTLTEYAGDQPPTPDVVAAAAGKSASTQVAIDQGLSFFDDVTKDQSWFNDDDKKQAARFRDLVALLKGLDHVRVYRVGETTVDVFALGRDKVGAWVGVRTTVVET